MTGNVCTGRQVDLSPVQRVPQPTRDVLVTRDEAGEREFSGFGAAQNDEYADCFIDASRLPEDTIKVASHTVVLNAFDCTPAQGHKLGLCVLSQGMRCHL